MASGAQPQAGSTKSCDKRDSARRPRRIMVRFGTRMADKTGFTKNISETGLFIQTNSVAKPGSTIQVNLQFPDLEFTMWARVRWAKKAPPQLAGLMGAGMGVQFIEPTQDWIDYFRGSVAN
jgi:Tfp pilus assembly protein PilZ